jgi:8-hydroxy-5-deazaflavin:NADPH oxidoreductase
MKFAVLGTGMVGSAVGNRLRSFGHEVVFGSRKAGGEKDGIPLLSHAEAVPGAEMVVLAMPGEQVVETLEGLPLAGKIVIDISNYDHAVDQPITDPLGETVQRAHPEAKVVKALDSVSAHLMVDPQSLGAPHTVFVAGNDDSAKAEVSDLLRSFGWEDIIDLGDLSAVRAMEQLIPLWMALEKVLGGPNFNLAVVRGPQPAK